MIRSDSPFLEIAPLVALTLSYCSAALAQNGLPQTIEAPPGSLYFGASVASGGDANNDGFDDILVTDDGAEPNGLLLGHWYMYSGRDWSLLWSGTGTEPSNPAVRFFACEFIGDIDGDQCDDIIIGREGLLDDRGGVAVLSGRTGDLIYSYQGGALGDRMGRAVCGMDDVNHDNVPDFAFTGRYTETGFVSVRSGADGSELLRYDTPWPRRMRDAGDINGDLTPDLAIGLCDAVSHGIRLEVVSVADGQQVYEVLPPDPSFDSTFGYQVAAGTDVTGDQVPDLLVSGSTFFGRAHLISGATGEILLMYEAPGGETNQKFSVNLFFGDVTGDGQAECIIGSYEQTYAYEPLSALRLSAWISDDDRPYIAGGECAVGDVNNDGLTDVVLAAYRQTPQAGSVRVFSGGTMLLRRSGGDYPLRNVVRRGRATRFHIYSGQPERPVRLLASRSGIGCTFVPQLGICIDMRQSIVVLDTATTDSLGFAEFRVEVPPRFPLGPAWLQALDVNDPVRGPITSNVMELRVISE